MRRVLFIFLLACLTVPGYGATPEIPELPREFRGAWVASVFNLNWPSKPNLSTTEQQEELRLLLNRAADLHLNALLLQVRPSSDALYASKIEPWSAFLTGASGRAPSPAWDPLEWAVKEAHARGLELHAWFNPFRAATATTAAFASNHITRTHPGWIRRFGPQSWIDPGEPAAREYVRSVIMDVVRRYDIDGVHIDDYFYPYPVKSGATFPDGPTYQRYQRAGGQLSLGDWRRDNTNQFVESLNRAIHAEKSWVKFGVSPFGIWRPHVPASIVAGVDSFDQLYADSRRWLAQGWCDYLAPQLYWPSDPPDQSFPVLLEWWRAQSAAGRPVWPGIASSRVGEKFPAQEIVRQISTIRQASTAAPALSPGHIHWDMKSVQRNQGGVAALLSAKCYGAVALPPPATWLGKETPAIPKVEWQGGIVRTRSEGAAPSRWWALQSHTREGWTLRIYPGSETVFTPPVGADVVALRAVDRFGNASAPAVPSSK